MNLYGSDSEELKYMSAHPKPQYIAQMYLQSLCYKKVGATLLRKGYNF
jgi:hypothetical protein